VSYTANKQDTGLVRRAAKAIGEEAQALFEAHTVGGEWPDDGASYSVEEVYQDLRTIQARLDDLAERMRT
jgi:hypothetical protein